MKISENEREVLRKLADCYADCALSERNQQTIKDWKVLNSLKPSRPMVTIDQIPWHEIKGEELTLLCENETLRELEERLRRELYKWRHLDTDQTLPLFIEVPKAIADGGIGVEIQEETTALDQNNDVVSHDYKDVLETEEQLEALHPPIIRHDEEETSRRVGLVESLVGDILPVRAVGVQPQFRVWDIIAMLRSVTPIFMDMIDRPELIHATMKKFLEIELSRLRQLEEQNLLNPYANLVHCSGTHTDELPAEGFDPNRARGIDCWGFGMAQLFASCSREMHQEFEFQYAAEYYRHVGLVYYGCCEPLHQKIDLVKKLPHVRKISVSPWADVEEAAQNIGKDYVLSRKPNPAYLATGVDEDSIRSEIRATLQSCRRYDTPVEFLLKDLSTLQYKPERLSRWSQIMREEAARLN